MSSFRWEKGVASSSAPLDVLVAWLPAGTEVEVWGDSTMWVILPPRAVEAGSTRRMPLRVYLDAEKARRESAADRIDQEHEQLLDEEMGGRGG